MAFQFIIETYIKGELFMERASRVMYSIANFFSWIIVICCVAGIVVSSLFLAGVIKEMPDIPFVGAGGLVYFIVVLVFSLLAIMLVRIAKDRRSSKGWDVLFIVLGVLGNNIFYILGGIFGVIAIRR